MCERFVWGELADWYLEAAKPRAKAGEPATLATLAYVMDRALRLLHPILPYVTEALALQLWERAPTSEGAPSLMLAAWPLPEARDADAEERFGLVMEVVRAIRNLRQEQGIAPGAIVDALVDGGRATLEPERDLVQRLAACRLAFGARDGMATVVRGLPGRDAHFRRVTFGGALARGGLERPGARAARAAAAPGRSRVRRRPPPVQHPLRRGQAPGDRALRGTRGRARMHLVRQALYDPARAPLRRAQLRRLVNGTRPRRRRRPHERGHGRRRPCGDRGGRPAQPRLPRGCRRGGGAPPPRVFPPRAPPAL